MRAHDRAPPPSPNEDINTVEMTAPCRFDCVAMGLMSAADADVKVSDETFAAYLEDGIHRDVPVAIVEKEKQLPVVGDSPSTLAQAASPELEETPANRAKLARARALCQVWDAEDKMRMASELDALASYPTRLPPELPSKPEYDGLSAPALRAARTRLQHAKPAEPAPGCSSRLSKEENASFLVDKPDSVLTGMVSGNTVVGALRNLGKVQASAPAIVSWLYARVDQLIVDPLYTRPVEDRSVVDRVCPLMPVSVEISRISLMLTRKTGWRDVVKGMGRAAVSAATYGTGLPAAAPLVQAATSAVASTCVAGIRSFYSGARSFIRAADAITSAFNQHPEQRLYANGYVGEGNLVRKIEEVAAQPGAFLEAAQESVKESAVGFYDWLVNSREPEDHTFYVCNHVLDMLFSERPNITPQECEREIPRFFVRCGQLALPHNFKERIVEGTILAARVIAAEKGFCKAQSLLWSVNQAGLRLC